MILLRRETINGNEIKEIIGLFGRTTLVNNTVVDAEYDEVVHKYRLRKDIDAYVKLGRVSK